MSVVLASIPVPTRGRGQFVDITGQVAQEVEASGVREGVALLRSRHTTAAITCQEGDSTIHEDCRELLGELLPLSKRYRHSYEGAENATAHLATMLLFGESAWVPIRERRPDLGTWQRLFLVELCEPRSRRVDLAILGE
jgi:secondary thiamine-phosphate synthase enzyme